MSELLHESANCLKALCISRQTWTWVFKPCKSKKCGGWKGKNGNSSGKFPNILFNWEDAQWYEPVFEKLLVLLQVRVWGGRWALKHVWDGLYLVSGVDMKRRYETSPGVLLFAVVFCFSAPWRAWMWCCSTETRDQPPKFSTAVNKSRYFNPAPPSNCR